MDAVTLQLDHLVLAAGTLEAGVAHMAEALGVSPGAFSAEGKHPVMGTHNRLLGIDGSCYLEVIAVDPGAAPLPPGRKRWFGLGDAALLASLAQRPRLLHWVARVPPGAAADLGELSARFPDLVPEVVSLERGSFRWRIGVPPDGSLPSCPGGAPSGDGVIPTVIQWDVEATPAQKLPPSGLGLCKLVGRHKQLEPVQAAVTALGAGDLIHLQILDGEACLEAEFMTTTGVRVLR
ncbi:hypothetical protein N2152v2_007271 [Parachlorella kessleri]